MSKKRKGRGVRSSAGRRSKQPIDLEAARNLVANGQFRDAIAAFKQLRKESGFSQELIEGLGSAYAGRAEQLCAKGMENEALAIWENRAELGTLPISADHVLLLLRLGRMDRLQALLRVRAESQLDPKLREHLAVHYLSGRQEIAKLLPEDDPILSHGPAAKAALEAYCRGDDETLTESMSGIPFRSPYRDFAQILKALLKIPGAADEARRLLERIDDASAFAHLRNAALQALAGERGAPLVGTDTRGAVAELVAALRGWSEERKRLWHELRALGDPVPLKSLLKYMYRNREALGEAWVDARGLRLLFPGFPDNHRWLSEVRGLRLEDTDVHRLAAWDAERDQEPWGVLESWEQCAGDLEPLAKGRPGGAVAKRVALMLRRTTQVFEPFDDSPDGDPDSLAGECARQLERSLSFDPEDRETYLHLIRYRLGTGELKGARALLQDAQARWPDDKQVLMVAIETALAGGAYKKAAGMARAVLAVDPINSSVRARLVESHLAHARKNLKKGRSDLAANTLAEAREWARGEAQTEQLDLVAAFADLARDSSSGTESLREFADRLGNGLGARFLISLEADRQAKLGNAILKRIGLQRSPAATSSDLLGFLKRLRQHLDDGGKLPRGFEDSFGKSLRAAARLRLEKGQYESACETLERASLDDARRAFAEAALKRWRGDPLFELHAIEASYAATPFFDPSNAEVRRLERAMERARETGDMRVLHRLTELLDMAYGHFPPLPGPSVCAGPDDEGLPDLGAFSIFEDIIRTLGIEGIYELLKTDNPLGQALKGLERETGKTKFRALLEQIAEGIGDSPFHVGSDDGLDPFLDVPLPSPSSRRRRKPKKPRQTPSAQDQGPPIQPDLFGPDEEY